MWGECRQSGGRTGLHTYPDLEVVQLVDPETGEVASGTAVQELVVTQLGFRGTALLRWRTGDLADGLDDSACPSCGRTVPRVTGLRPGVLVPAMELRGGARAVDVRGVSAALVGRADVLDWRVVLARSARDDTDELLGHVVPADSADPAEIAVAVARDVRAAAGLLPTQVVITDEDDLPADGWALSPRVLSRQ
jgi:hypothetical protein